MAPRPQRERTSPLLLTIALLCALAVLPLGAFAQTAKRGAIMFAINEGATTQVTVVELIDRYTARERRRERARRSGHKRGVSRNIAGPRAERARHLRRDVRRDSQHASGRAG